MSRIVALLVSSAALVCGIGCSSAGSEPDYSWDGTAHEYLAELGRLRCNQARLCDFSIGGAIISLANVRGQSPDECLAREDLRFYPSTERALANGTVVFDVAAARRCLASYVPELCIGGLDDAACSGVFNGTVAVGGECEFGSQCESGSCSGYSDTCGVCEPVVELGDSCEGSPAPNCPGGSTCTATPDGSRCTSTFHFREIRQVGRGGTCSTDAISGPAILYCAPELYCSFDRVCVSRLPAGAACNPQLDQCPLDQVCADAGSAEPRCVDIVVATTAGMPCNLEADPVVVCDFDSRLYCASDETCVALAGSGELGSDCLEDSQCDSGLCAELPFPGECVVATVAEGETCKTDEQCPSARCERPNGIDWICVPSPCP